MVSIAQYRQMVKKPSKYRSIKVEYTDENGKKQKKDSIKEYRRGIYLKELEKEGKISNLEEQVVFMLQDKIIAPNGKVLERAIKFVADYVYHDDDKTSETYGMDIIEDVKSWITKRNTTYILKRKLFKMYYPKYYFKEF